jgi:hypothetical protein
MKAPSIKHLRKRMAYWQDILNLRVDHRSQVDER